MFILHHNDWDGKASAAIVYQKYETTETIKLQKINYNEQVKFDQIEPNEEVFIVDFSLNTREDWDKLYSITKNITWIDHHKTALEKWPLEDKNLKGKRDVTKSGCLLCWEYCFPTKKVPNVIEYLNDYDLWKFELGISTKNLQSGLSFYHKDYNPTSISWKTLLFDQDLEPLIEILKIGSVISQYKIDENIALVKHSYFINFEGYKAICVNGKGNSSVFDSIDPSLFDIMILYSYTNQKNWVVGIYTKKDNIDVSAIAKKYGGGGHLKAAGWTTNDITLLLE